MGCYVDVNGALALDQSEGSEIEKATWWYNIDGDNCRTWQRYQWKAVGSESLYGLLCINIGKKGPMLFLGTAGLS